MRVRALVSFAARIDGDVRAVQAGTLIDMPEGCDWLTAGLVTVATLTAAPALTEAVELATAEPDAEVATLRAVKVRPARRKAGTA